MSTEKKIVELTTYNFEAKLEYLDEYKEKDGSSCFRVPFQVLAEDRFKAQEILEKWLSNPSQTGYKFKKCVGIRLKPANSVLIQNDFTIEE